MRELIELQMSLIRNSVRQLILCIRTGSARRRQPINPLASAAGLSGRTINRFLCPDQFGSSLAR